MSTCIPQVPVSAQLLPLLVLRGINEGALRIILVFWEATTTKLIGWTGWQGCCVIHSFLWQKKFICSGYQELRMLFAFNKSLTDLRRSVTWATWMLFKKKKGMAGICADNYVCIPLTIFSLSSTRENFKKCNNISSVRNILDDWIKASIVLRCVLLVP